MTFLEFFNLSKNEKQSGSINTGSLSKDARSHRHQKGMYGLNQVSGKTKKINAVARYLINSDDLVTRCRKTGKDQVINLPAAIAISKKYNHGISDAIPTLQSPQKGIKGTGVYLILDPNGKTYRLRYKGVQNGKA
jgi:hypothetical protein